MEKYDAAVAWMHRNNCVAWYKRPVRILSLLLFSLLFGSAIAEPLQSTLTVNLERGGRGGEPSPFFSYGGGVWHIPRAFPWAEQQILELPRQELIA